MYTTYTVQPDDTLWSIGREFGVPIEVLLTENNLRNANELTVGQQLRIPAATTPYWYCVRRGDSLYSIANKFYTTVEQLMQLNDIANPNLIFPGQLIMIR